MTLTAPATRNRTHHRAATQLSVAELEHVAASIRADIIQMIA